MVHLDGAPGAGAETDFEGFTLDQLRDMVTMANPSSLAGYGAQLKGASDKVTRASQDLTACLNVIGEAWQGPSADRFGDWARQVIHAANAFGDYTLAAGNHIEHVGFQIFVAKMGIPQVDAATVATANQGPVALISQASHPAPGTDPVLEHEMAKARVESARREAITQLRTLASTYRVTAGDLRGLPAPVFPEPAVGFDQNDGSSIAAPGGISGGGGTGVSPSGEAGFTPSASTRAGTSVSGGGGIQSAPLGYVPAPGSAYMSEQPASPGTSSTGYATQTPQGGVYQSPQESVYTSLPDSVHAPLPGPVQIPEQLASSGAPVPSPMPQTTHLQGSGTLTGPGPADTSWTPQVSGSGPQSMSLPHASSPPGAAPGMFPPPGIGPGRSPNGPSGTIRTSSGGGGGSTAPPRGGGFPSAVPGGGAPPGTGRPAGRTPGTGGGQGAFTTRPVVQGGTGTTAPGGAATGTNGRSPMMPGASGGGGVPGGPSRGTPDRRLANSPGGSVGGAGGAASRRNSPTLRALPANGEPPVGGSSGATPAGRRTPFTGGARAEQVRPHRMRPQDDEDNVWDGPRRPGVVPPVID